MDELVAVGAVAEHERVGAVGDPVEQHGEDAQAAVADDRARPHDRDVEAAGGGVQARPLGGELGGAVGLCGRGTVSRRTGLDCRDPEHGARREVDDLADPGGAARLQQRRRPIDVDRAQRPGSRPSGTSATQW